MLRMGKGGLCVTLSEAKAYLRLDDGQEEAMLAGLLRAASDCCEHFIDTVLLVRDFEVDVTAPAGAVQLKLAPVREITGIHVLGEAEAIDPATYTIDFDQHGAVSIVGLMEGCRYTISGVAGLADGPNDVPEQIRQGILCLTASYFDNRSDQHLALPPAVTSLWRPYRRSGLQR